MTKVMKEIRTV